VSISIDEWEAGAARRFDAERVGLAHSRIESLEAPADDDDAEGARRLEMSRQAGHFARRVIRSLVGDAERTVVNVGGAPARRTTSRTGPRSPAPVLQTGTCRPRYVTCCKTTGAVQRASLTIIRDGTLFARASLSPGDVHRHGWRPAQNAAVGSVPFRATFALWPWLDRASDSDRLRPVRPAAGVQPLTACGGDRLSGLLHEYEGSVARVTEFLVRTPSRWRT
jgi:hypothetical protein